MPSLRVIVKINLLGVNGERYMTQGTGSWPNASGLRPSSHCRYLFLFVGELMSEAQRVQWRPCWLDCCHQLGPPIWQHLCSCCISTESDCLTRLAARRCHPPPKPNSQAAICACPCCAFFAGVHRAREELFFSAATCCLLSVVVP